MSALAVLGLLAVWAAIYTLLFVIPWAAVEIGWRVVEAVEVRR